MNKGKFREVTLQKEEVVVVALTLMGECSVQVLVGIANGYIVARKAR